MDQCLPTWVLFQAAAKEAEETGPQMITADAQLLSDFRSENEAVARAAFEAVWSLHRDSMHRTANRIVHGRTGAIDAEDIVAESFMNAWTYRRQANRNLCAWLLTIVRNAACRARRKGRQDPALPATTSAMGDGDEPHPDFPLEGVLNRTPLDELSQAELRREIARCLDQLPDCQREVLKLHYFDGLTLAEIAGCTQTSPGTVASRYAAGKAALRKHLNHRPAMQT
jgi:RNA polymerase sigma-70 factor, ECF subfamily